MNGTTTSNLIFFPYMFLHLNHQSEDFRPIARPSYAGLVQLMAYSASLKAHSNCVSSEAVSSA
eukprot:1530574-Amphidinium_carterae.2